MNAIRILRAIIVMLALVNLVLPCRMVAAATAKTDALAVRPDLCHVTLSRQGSLVGQLRDNQGKPLGHHPVALYEARNPQPKSGPVKELTTDAEGRFEFKSLKGEAYIIVADESVVVCRCWSQKLAPPAAKQELLMVADREIQRGQNPIGEMLFANPIIMILLIAAAIAIPIAIHNSQNDAS